MSNPLKIISISSEVAPYSKSGGLADVSRSLPKAIKRLGHDVTIITPLYGGIFSDKKYDLKIFKENVSVDVDKENKIIVNFWVSYLMEGLPIYFIENNKYFSKKKELYGSKHDNVRFLIFDLACLELIDQLDCQPDIIHCHDWQTGLIPYYLRKEKRYKKLEAVKIVYTIHNLIFQLGHNWWEIAPENKDFGKKAIPLITDPAIENINFAKRAILSADIINTVSEKYREEIMTKNFGQDLQTILRNRSDRLLGIINGIDYNAYSPTRDNNLFKKYNYKNIYYKKINKEELQKKFSLPINTNVPLLCTTSRVTFQKGFELILNIANNLMQLDIQLIVLGSGSKDYIKKLKKIAKKYPKKLVVIPFHKETQKYETFIYSGSDFFLLPSHHEPCGINQLIAMRYGCIPIVRKVGGLHDTVENYDPSKDTGTGFVFDGFNEFSLYGAIVRAIEIYKHKYIWKNIITRAMKQSSSWTIPAKKYITLYKKIIQSKNDNKPIFEEPGLEKKLNEESVLAEDLIIEK
ncbi:MAG: glycogen/starch synthase [Candidatus Falkowbacteria bacterium]|nr:glycogen/starch synthase [Candidatus Falkowbacteria bacterium]